MFCAPGGGADAFRFISGADSALASTEGVGGVGIVRSSTNGSGHDAVVVTL